MALAGSLLIAGAVLGKHVHRDVPPVEIGGVRYVAPNDEGWRGHVQAWDAETTNLLWDVTLYRVLVHNPLLEPDATYVLIKTMRARGGTLIIMDERDRYYRLDPRTRNPERISREEGSGTDTNSAVKVAEPGAAPAPRAPR